MDITNSSIDSGRPFDFGRISSDYAKYRDIYPPVFYRKIADLGLCVKGRRVLDIGTGTGVLPRNMYSYGAQWVGVDISPDQIARAKALAEAEHKDIAFYTCSAEDIDFDDGSFDDVTACQCFWYFDANVLIPGLARVLRSGGSLVLMNMEWLPFEDKIAYASEQLVLKYNPAWSGAGEVRKPVFIPDIALQYFTLSACEDYDLNVHFTREGWHGRMRSCRGVGASLDEKSLELWEKEHTLMLENSAPPEFDVLHHAAYAVLKKK